MDNSTAAPNVPLKKPENPHEIFRLITATGWRLLDELTYLEGLRKKRAPGLAVYTTPSTTYLAGKCAVTRWTISRTTEQLVELGVLIKKFRRQVAGKFQTCLYVVNPKFKWRIERVKSAISSVTSRVRKPAHKQAKAVEITDKPSRSAPKRTQPPPEWAALRSKLRGGD